MLFGTVFVAVSRTRSTGSWPAAPWSVRSSVRSDNAVTKGAICQYVVTWPD